MHTYNYCVYVDRYPFQGCSHMHFLNHHSKANEEEGLLILIFQTAKKVQ